LTFTLSRPQGHPVEIRRGTRVSAARSGAGKEPPVFVTAQTVSIEPGAAQAEVLAHHCDWVEAELAGTGNGLPGLSLKVGRPPVVAPTGDGLDLIVAVEAAPKELDVAAPAVKHEGKAYRIWREVENFSNLGPDRFAYLVDRRHGIITFAPALRILSDDATLKETPEALAAVPKDGAGILISYRSGGGADGNVPANTLTVLKDPIPGVEVTNHHPATGGRSAETLENALLRGPQHIHSLRRVVTARDFELAAMRGSGAVEQARAFTKAMLWSHAPPGMVEVLLVPTVPVEARGEYGRVSAEIIRRHETDTARTQIQQALDEGRPVATNCEVSWGPPKEVAVMASVVCYRQENPAAVKARLLQRLYQTISPLSTPPETQGWPFGRALTGWDVYKIMSTEPGVISVSQVRLIVDAAPDKSVRALASDGFQANTWYAAKDHTVFRSMNGGKGWETVGRFTGEEVDQIETYPRATGASTRHAGLVAVATRLTGENEGSRLHISRDCGETWEPGPQTQFAIEDMAWMERDGVASLLLATELGLYELAARAKAVPRQVSVDAKDPALGFYAVAVATAASGGTSVAVAARDERGVFLSSEGARPNTFKHIGLNGELVRELDVQNRDLDQYLWAGVAAPGEQLGTGCFRWRLTGSAESVEGWRPYQKDWKGGSCRALAFQGSKVLAATSRLGVLRLDVDTHEPRWEAPDVHCGLPLHEVGRLEPVDAVVTEPGGKLAMAAGIQGVYRSRDQGLRYEYCSGREFADEVTLPKTWLLCSGEHEIEVVSEDEAQRN
jgi:hypothetical protein